MFGPCRTEKLNVLQPNLLLLTDDGDFARDLLARWQQERVIPSFSVSGNEALNGATAPECDLAIVARVQHTRLVPILKALDSATRPTLCVCDASQIDMLRGTMPRIVFVADFNAGTIVTVAVEMLRRIEAINRARKAEQVVARYEHDATMGRFVAESRHALNNALTSILGNSELLLMDPSRFPEEVREQIETIHSMSLKIHEMLYRLGSLEAERRFAEKASQAETRPWAESAAAGD